MTAIALTIAGSDPSGGAGLQADLKTFHQHGVYGASVVTLLTVQNTQRVDAVEPVAPEMILAQLDAVLEDIPPTAAKTGALGNAAAIEALAARAGDFAFPLVVDPVMVSKHGASLLEPKAVAVLQNLLLPKAFLVTPNRAEASLLSGVEVLDLATMERAAAVIARRGPPHVLIKGSSIDNEDAIDVLWSDGQFEWFTAPRVDTLHTHGSGCVFSAAITAQLALGTPLREAIRRAKLFVTEAIRSHPRLGHGFGPVNTHADVQ